MLSGNIKLHPLFFVLLTFFSKPIYQEIKVFFGYYVLIRTVISVLWFRSQVGRLRGNEILHHQNEPGTLCAQ